MLRHTSVFQRNYRELACSVKEQNVVPHPPFSFFVLLCLSRHVCLPLCPSRMCIRSACVPALTLLHCFVCFCCGFVSPSVEGLFCL